MENILITGNLGFVGSNLVSVLSKAGYNIVGLDSHYYDGCEFSKLPKVGKQIIKDVREVTEEDLSGIDTIIHLAALSNDPLGELNPKPTMDINYKASVRLAKLAKKCGIKLFVFASSQGMYGVSSGVVNEESAKNPLTAYARSKVMAEEEILSLGDTHFTSTALRSTTVCGVSPMIRCDVLLNTMVSDALTKGEITVNSPRPIWRSVVHVNDLCNAYNAVLDAPNELVNREVFNVGTNENNHTIVEFAQLVKKHLPSTKVNVYDNLPADARTYKVDFSKIKRILGKYFHPVYDLDSSVEELIAKLHRHNLTANEVQNKFIRLNRIKSLISSGKVDESFMWRKDPRYFP